LQELSEDATQAVADGKYPLGQLPPLGLAKAYFAEEVGAQAEPDG